MSPKVKAYYYGANYKEEFTVDYGTVFDPVSVDHDDLAKNIGQTIVRLINKGRTTNMDIEAVSFVVTFVNY